MSHDASPRSRRAALRTLALTVGATALPAAFHFRSGIAMAAASPSPAASAAATPAPITSTSLGSKLSLITGAGGNIALLDGEDDVLLIDSGLPNLATQTLAEVAKTGPVTALINTHWHFDHTGGNESLAGAGAGIMAHENCRKRMTTEQYVEALDRRLPASAPAALPRVTFSSETKLHLNDEEIRLVPVEPAHTDGDVIVRFEKADVLHAGDLFFHGSYPFIDYSSGGWIGGMVAAVKTIAGLAGANTRIIPGHGKLATPDDLKSYLAFLETMLERFTKFKAEGRTVEEVIAAAPTKDFDETLGKSFLKPEPFVRITYTGLLKRG
jgi:glyoxylase-like metal-dependent hydrolase (beta-lactamase superfamily II)